ncbi:hypothetical protein HGRIS_014673 [Hohenbuehelia grisea]|uniref:Uncharacterized protein n=1 Tax=Hohenbuehelia grisea TaxID=104357 RepID=A0ABR3JUA3_9AGAR
MADRPRNINSVYHPCIADQRQSTELVIFAPELGHTVEISFPTRGSGLCIIGIKELLRRRKVAWSCFCALTECKAVSCCIVEAADTGMVYAFCHYNPSRCGFFMNITEKRRSAQSQSSFPEFLPHGKRSRNAPDIDALVVSFQLQNSESPEGPVLFEGYLGSYGQVQLSGPDLDLTPMNHQPSYPRRPGQGMPRATYAGFGNVHLIPPLILPPLDGREYSPGSRDIVSPPSSPVSRSASLQPTAGPSRLALAGPSQPTEAHPRSGLSIPEAAGLRQLFAGEGVVCYDWLGLVEECQQCGKYFAGSILRSHIPQCLVP